VSVLCIVQVRHDETHDGEFYNRFCRFFGPAGSGLYRLYYEIHLAARLGGARPGFSRRQTGDRGQVSLVDGSSSMGRHPLLSGRNFRRSNAHTHHPALDLDKGLCKVPLSPHPKAPLAAKSTIFSHPPY
jgi:hypothetical protein